MRSSFFSRFLAGAVLVTISSAGLIGQTPAQPAAQTPPPAIAAATGNDGRLTDAQAIKLYERTLQLMEAGGIFLPDLTRASKPLIENARQTLESIKFLGQRNPQLHYRWLATVRAYLLLSDTLPKPVPFPDE